jgi:PhnB protein
MNERNGYRRVTSYLCVKGAAAAIDFYARAFGAVERYRLPNPDGTLGHAEVVIGETLLMVSDEAPSLGVLSPTSLGGSPVSLVLDVDNVDVAWDRALAAGAAVARPLKDEPYGRSGWLTDPFGNRWSLMTANPDFDPNDLKAEAAV